MDATRATAWWRRRVAGATALYALACTFSVGGLADLRTWGDPGIYEDYAERLLAGELPYRDFYVEYPPGAFAVFAPPELVERATGLHYLPAFKLEMALLGVPMLLLVARLLVRLAAPPREATAALGLVAVTPLALGHLFLNRYDVWPALLVVGALAALLARRHVLAAALLGISFAAKVFAAAVAPLAALRTLRESGVERLGRGVLAFAAAAAAVFGVFVVVAPGGVGYSLWTQATRDLHTESLGGSILLALDQLGLYDARIVAGLGIDLGGSLAQGVATASSVLQAVTVLGVALLYLRGGESDRRLAAAFAAAVTAFVVLAKALSPQFLVWLVPLAVLASRRRPLVLGLLAASLLLTQAEVHGYVGLTIAGWAVWVLLLRNVLLVALLALLVAEVAEAPADSPHPGSRLRRA